jgi:phosphoenolpyruvate synthase/pyruvate phosphate dikinase
MLDENRLFTESIYPEIEQFFVQLTKEIEKKARLPPHLLRELHKEELYAYLKDKSLPTKQILEARYQSNVQLFDSMEDKLLTGKKAKEIEEQIHTHHSSEEIKGQTAYPGIAKGKVKIILDPKNSQHFEEGDILVTNMTRPEFVPLMEKAAAIVTDSGGLLCHAAVVAREMKKTTLIGTENATKFFKDNDFVEVNAPKGVIRVIK